MKMATKYSCLVFDFLNEEENFSEDIWRMCTDGAGYPRLSWEFEEHGDFRCPDGVDMLDFGAMSNCWLLISHSEIMGNYDINIEDIALFSQYWMDSEKPECEMVDMTENNTIDLEDFIIFCENWLVGE